MLQRCNAGRRLRIAEKITTAQTPAASTIRNKRWNVRQITQQQRGNQQNTQADDQGLQNPACRQHRPLTLGHFFKRVANAI